MLAKQKIINFNQKINNSLIKDNITVLQINLGKKCNLACHHCHVEASPKREEELTSKVCQQLITVINQFPQIETIDLTGGAPEMHYGFKELVKAGKDNNKEVIVRTNLTIFFESGYEYLPEYFAENQVHLVASLPCYLEDNVDQQRGKGVYNSSILALKKLNQLGYGWDNFGTEAHNLIIDLVYNSPLPKDDNFRLTPEQKILEEQYKTYLEKEYNVKFNRLYTITNLPIGRTNIYLQKYNIRDKYLEFLADNFNRQTLPYLMCKNQLSVDYLGNIYDCDFNQMESLFATDKSGKKITLDDIIEHNSLDLIQQIKTADYCYGCTAGSGSSCSGALL